MWQTFYKTANGIGIFCIYDTSVAFSMDYLLWCDSANSNNLKCTMFHWTSYKQALHTATFISVTNTTRLCIASVAIHVCIAAMSVGWLPLCYSPWAFRIGFGTIFLSLAFHMFLHRNQRFHPNPNTLLRAHCTAIKEPLASCVAKTYTIGLFLSVVIRERG
jgi:hypothetical protein